MWRLVSTADVFFNGWLAFSTNDVVVGELHSIDPESDYLSVSHRPGDLALKKNKKCGFTGFGRTCGKQFAAIQVGALDTRRTQSHHASCI